VIEAIAERLDWKLALYEKILPHLAPHTILASNTSGISISQLSKAFSNEVKERFCGVHFFNPPRYMHLLELIPTKWTKGEILDRLENFFTSTLGKGIIRANDTPNFVANRVGVFSILAVIKEAEKFQLGFDVVDALTGTALGRAKSATFRTADVVGIDTLAHVIKTMEDNLEKDPFHSNYQAPEVITYLLKNNALGQKSGKGFYQKMVEISKS
jgi:3-hydroxyacyl-CoA dehydrogenase